MHTLMKYGLKSCLGLILACSMLDVAWASSAACKKKVSEHCTKELCQQYCTNASKGADECNCNAMNGLCKVTATNRKDQLFGLTQAQLAACNDGKSETEWKAVVTTEWTALMPKESTANKNEDVRDGEMRVGEATKLAEKLVHEECVKVLAPKYAKVKDLGDYDAEDLCKNTPANADELIAQKEALLMACIAAKRDPNARKTGRPEYGCSAKTPIPWCSINSPSWRETILYPDPEKAAKKQRYIDSLVDLSTKIDEAKKAKLDHSDLDQQLKELVLEKSLGQLAEETSEADICSGARAVAECRGGTKISAAPVIDEVLIERGA
ncbi:MAG: hypothetical protein V4482_04590 [Pseudomonadota bacterium]